MVRKAGVPAVEALGCVGKSDGRDRNILITDGTILLYDLSNRRLSTLLLP